MKAKVTKRKTTNVPSEGRYEWRDEAGKLRGVEIVRPAKGPSSVSVAEIRRAIDKLNGARKTK
jgi:hypothetical protein